MRMRYLIAFICAVAFPFNASAQDTHRLGIVLLGGKLGGVMGSCCTRANGTPIGGWLVVALRNAGYLVATPETCWSRVRSFDKSYPECLAELDDVVAGLKSQGATGIVVGGLSLGGNAAIAYGATRPGLAGIIGLSPADQPEPKMQYPEFATSIAKAQGLVAQGKSDDKATFDDVSTNGNGHYSLTENTTPRIFLSFFAPDGLGDIPANLPHLTAPLLWVSGDDDPSQMNAREYFARAASSPLNRYVVVHGAHTDVPDAATDAVLAWLKALP